MSRKTHSCGASRSPESSMSPKKSDKADGIRKDLIAPCGMNCRLCRAYGRKRNPCPGCRADDSRKPRTRVCCRIKNCEKRAGAGERFCFRCNEFPCPDLNRLDKRYRTRYGMSMIDNLTTIRKSGTRSFLRKEKARWTCPGCGELLCVHEPECPSCRGVSQVREYSAPRRL